MQLWLPGQFSSSELSRQSENPSQTNLIGTVYPGHWWLHLSSSESSGQFLMTVVVFVDCGNVVSFALLSPKISFRRNFRTLISSTWTKMPGSMLEQSKNAPWTIPIKKYLFSSGNQVTTGPPWKKENIDLCMAHLMFEVFQLASNIETVDELWMLIYFLLFC